MTDQQCNRFSGNKRFTKAQNQFSNRQITGFQNQRFFVANLKYSENSFIVGNCNCYKLLYFICMYFFFQRNQRYRNEIFKDKKYIKRLNNLKLKSRQLNSSVKRNV